MAQFYYTKHNFIWSIKNNRVNVDANIIVMTNNWKQLLIALYTSTFFLPFILILIFVVLILATERT